MKFPQETVPWARNWETSLTNRDLNRCHLFIKKYGEEWVPPVPFFPPKTLSLLDLEHGQPAKTSKHYLLQVPSKVWKEFSKRGKTPALFSQQCPTVSAQLLVTKCCTAFKLGETSRHVPAAMGPGPVLLMAPQKLMLNMKGTDHVDSTARQYFVLFAF